MKKIISICVALALLCSTAIPLSLLSVLADNGAIKAHLFVEGVQSGKSLKDLPDLYDQDWSDNCTSEFTGVDSLLSYTTEPSVKFDNTAVVDNYGFDSQCTFKMNKKAAHGSSFLFYVKTPAGASHDLFFVATSGYPDVRQSLKAGEDFYLLNVNGSTWEHKNVKAWASDDDDGLIELPAGFEGYVRIPLNTLYNETSNKDTEKLNSNSPIDIIGLRLSNYGGSYGPAYFGPVMVMENDTDSTEISFNGGEAVSLVKKETVEDPINAHILISDIEVGQPVNLHAEGGSTKFTGIDSLVSYDNHAAMEFSSSKNITAIVGTEQASFDLPNVKLNGKAFLYYIETPDNGEHIMYMNTGTNNNTYWPRTKVGKPYQVLVNGSTKWEDKEFDHCPTWSATDTDGVAILPSGFCGYVRIPFSGLYQSNPATETPTAETGLSRLGLRFTNYGGDLGTVKVGPIMIDENMSNSTKLALDGNDPVQLVSSVSAHLLVSDIEVGKAVNLQHEGGATTFTGINSLVKYDNHAAMEVANANSITAITGIEQASFNFGNIKLNGKAFLYYVETPDNGEHLVYTLAGTENYSYWPRTKVGKPYQLLSNGSTKWEDKEVDHCPTWKPDDTDGVVVLPSGFCGYVRIPFSGLYQSNPTTETPTADTRITRFGLRFTNYGGDLGTVKVGPIMIDENMSNSTLISLEGGNPSKMQQSTSSGSTGEETKGDGLNLDLISRFDTLAVGDDMAKAGYASASPDVTVKAVHSLLGYTDYPAASIDSENAISVDKSGVDGTNSYSYLHIYQTLTDSNAIMFYVKMPAKENKMFLVVETNTDGSTTPSSWPRVEKDCEYSLLSKDSKTWTNKTTIQANGNNGLMEFDAGFEGYVKIPLSSIKWTDNNNEVVNSSYTITRLLFRCSEYGGATGPITVGPVFRVTQDADENTAYINGSKDKTDLFMATTYDPTKPLLNFQAMSDTHVDNYGSGNVSIGARHMIAALKDIKNLHPDTNAILHGGDLTETGSLAQYAQTYGYFDQYSPTKNIIATIGNHDIRGDLSTEGGVSYEDMLARYQKYNKKYFDTDLPYFDTWINGYHFIVLATDEKLKDEEVLHEDQMAWFAEKVQEGASSNKPIFVMTHNCITGTFSSNSYDCLTPSDDLRDIMNKYPQIVLFTGHLHSTDDEKMLISEGHGIFVDMPSLHNSNRLVDPTDALHNMYYNVNVYTDRLEINLYDYELAKNVHTFTINTSDFGKTNGDEPEAPKDKIMKAKLFDMIGDSAVGTDAYDAKKVIVHYAANEKNKATVSVTNSLNALTNTNAYKFDADQPIIRHGFDQTQFDVKFGDNEFVSMKKGQAFVWYVKLPEGDDGTGTNEIFFNIQNTNKSGGDYRWNRYPNGKIVKYLQKGTNKWATVTSNDTGVIKLPAGFEGYIYSPFADLVDDARFEGLDNTRYFDHLGLSVGYFGGDYGSFYCCPMLMATNDTVSKDGVMYNDSDKISNLFTGAEMTEDQVFEDPTLPPEIGSMAQELPVATTEDSTLHEIADSDITGTTVTLNWDAFDGAKKYRVDVYKSEYGAAGLTYRYAANAFVDGTSCTISGLEPSTKYFFIVNALNDAGVIIATYAEQAASTQYIPTSDPGADTKPTDPTVNNDDNDYVTGGASGDDYLGNGTSGNPLAQTGDTFPIMISLMFTISLAVVLFFRKDMNIAKK